MQSSRPWAKSLVKTLNQNKLGCFKNALRAPANQLPRCTLFFEVGNTWKKVQGGELIPWGNDLNTNQWNF